MKISRKSLWITSLIPIQIFVIQILKNKTDFIEYYYSNGLYPYISQFFRFVLGWIPFSVGDVLIFTILIAGIYFLVKLMKNKGSFFWRYFFNFTAFLSVLYGFFYLFWGLNYFRKPLAAQLNYKKNSYSTQDLKNVTLNIIDQANLYHLKISKSDSLASEISISKKEIYQKSIEAYQALAKKYPKFVYKNPSLKSSIQSIIQSYNGTSGYLNPITGEAQVNYLIPITGYPTTTCHEIAHQIGYAAENEANFIGFLACNYSKDSFFKYSSYRMALAYCLNEIRLRNPKLYPEIIKKINKGILKDYNNSYVFWQGYQNPFEPIIKKGYNAYLKANKQEKGIDSYNYVVDLLIQHYKNEKQI